MREKGVGNEEQNELLTWSSLSSIPMSFAVWRYGAEYVVISDRLKLVFSTDTNVLDSYRFVKLMRNVFGTFLDVAVRDILNQSSTLPKKQYVLKSFKMIREVFDLRLVFNTTTEVYTFVSEPKYDKNVSSGSDESDTILDHLPIYVWRRDRNSKITYCNESYAKALESTKDQVVSGGLELIPRTSRSSVYVSKGLYSGAKKFLEHIIVDGSRRLLSIEETAILKDQKSVGFAIDITDKEIVEKNYSNHKKQTEEVFDNISVPIVIFDERSVLHFANEAFIKLFSLEGLDLYGNCKFSDIINYMRSNNSIISSVDINKYQDAALNLFRTVIDTHRVDINLKNGGTMAVTISANRSGGLVFMFEDISEKVALEREINSLSAIQQVTLDHLSEGIMVFGADNRIKMMNSSIQLIWGRGNFTGIHISEFFENSTVKFETDGEKNVWISRLLNVASQRIDFTQTLNLASGKTINCSYTPLPNGLNLLRFLDVSDGTNLEKALREKTDMISQVDKLKSTLISNISYELRAPLQTIKGFSEILYNKYFGDLNEKQMEYCSGIANSVERVTDIVDAVISLANLEAGHIKIKYTEVKLLKFINEVISLFKDRAKAQVVSVVNEYHDEEFSVFIDENSMKQALFQLISRAMTITPGGGKITISVTFNEDHPDYFYLIVKDNGIALSDEDLEVMQQTLLNDSSNGVLSKSTEFGWVLSNNIIRLHNGKMTISLNTDGSGNTVTCQIPIRQFIQ